VPAAQEAVAPVEMVVQLQLEPTEHQTLVVVVVAPDLRLLRVSLNLVEVMVVPA
jgi:hypothetical protein